ncbi:DUF3499 domain-containing protein [Arthrobacter rhombi]|uniref:DUF3499 domain-containing protein n=1 Tax=Arthrobacter rhombi TaxID=71253 RepID=UPI003F8EE17A
MGSLRLCSRSACGRSAIATLTFVYADSTAVLGPLATYPEPHCYDLCSEHAHRLTVPRGWQVLRLELPEAPRVASDELSALADAVSEPRPPATDRRETLVEPESGPTNSISARTAPTPLDPPEDTDGGRGPLRILREPR